MFAFCIYIPNVLLNYFAIISKKLFEIYKRVERDKLILKNISLFFDVY